jgi:hypothetical protein
MDEANLRCRTQEDYDIRVRLHKEQGFTMIRNWVGMTGDESVILLFFFVDVIYYCCCCYAFLFMLYIYLFYHLSFLLAKSFFLVTLTLLTSDFYRACDKYGILIHDDFWLANPADGPNPQDNAMFMVCSWMSVSFVHACVLV